MKCRGSVQAEGLVNVGQQGQNRARVEDVPWLNPLGP